MENLTQILSQIYFGNSISDYVWLVGMLVIGLAFKKALTHLISNFLFKISKKIADDVTKEELFNLLHKPLSQFIMLAVIYVSASHIEFPKDWNLAPKNEFGIKMIIDRLYDLFIAISITSIALKMVDFIALILMKKAEKTDSKQDDQLIPFLVEILKVVVFIFSVFYVLGSVFDVNIGSLVAGLGIGGLALALAAKESLENLLGSFTIFFDKPFVIGDYVKIGDVQGTVEKIGFRSTRLRTLEKSYLTIPNIKMVNAELDNLSLRTFRRVKFNVGLVYGTSVEQIKGVVKDIQTLLDEHPNTNQDGKVRFMEFGASSLDVMVMYYIDTMDYGVFLEVKEEINFKIMEIVAKHKSDFAFPSQTVYLEK